MDSAETWGADGHDFKFGDEKAKDNRMFAQESAIDGATCPISDDGKDHNSYFGMHFTVDFQLPEGYCGDLEYCFFGDDDMWVFLDNQLILDIGGVHSSVGEYVDLWDYIDHGDTNIHTLSFFYTERGASGSTCWMNFTIPFAEFRATPGEQQDGSLSLEKSVLGPSNGPDQLFTFTLNVTDSNGNVSTGDYSYVRRDTNGELMNYGLITGGSAVFELTNGQSVTIPHLPTGFQYVITENEYSCDTSYMIGDQSVEGRTVGGTISAGDNIAITAVNDYTNRRLLPETGWAGSLPQHWQMCFIALNFAIACLITYIQRRKETY